MHCQYSDDNHFAYFQGDPHNLYDVEKFLTQMFNSVRYYPDTASAQARDLPSYSMGATDFMFTKSVFGYVTEAILESYGYNLM